MKADSKAGKALLSKARRLDQGGEVGSWAAQYSLVFQKCATSNEYYGGSFGGEENDNNGNSGYYGGVYEQKLVHFKLCETKTCGRGCSGPDYVVDMNYFLEAYMQYKMEADEQECDRLAKYCYCDNADDEEACAAACWMEAGIYEQCADANNGQEEEFQLEEAARCARLDIDEDAAQYYANNNNDGNNNNYYGSGQNGEGEMAFSVGPYCSSNGKSIYLGVFMEETCTVEAPEGVYEQFHYGNPLPYSTESIISDDCISCMRVDEDNGQNYYQSVDDDKYQYYYNNGEQPEVLEFCQSAYELAGKCEKDLNAYGVYPNTLACDYIKSLKAGSKTRYFKSLHGGSIWDSLRVVGLFTLFLLVFASATLAVTIFLAHSRKRRRKGESYMAFLLRDARQKGKKMKGKKKKRRKVKGNRDLEEAMLSGDGRSRSPRRSRSNSRTRSKSKSRSKSRPVREGRGGGGGGDEEERSVGAPSARSSKSRSKSWSKPRWMSRLRRGRDGSSLRDES